MLIDRLVHIKFVGNISWRRTSSLESDIRFKNDIMCDPYRDDAKDKVTIHIQIQLITFAYDTSNAIVLMRWFSNHGATQKWVGKYYRWVAVLLHTSENY